MYWEFLAEGGRKEPLLFQEQETSSIPAALGVRGALKTANAISTARVEGAHCATCDGPLTLKNRQALQKFAAKHTAKCRTCEGVNDIELRKTKQALLRASKEKEAQLHELDDFDPTTLLDFTCPISFDDPKILQAKQKLVDISRRARHKEYADIEQLIDAIPTAELPGLWAAANSSFLTYRPDELLEEINDESIEYPNWLVPSNGARSPFDEHVATLFNQGLVYRTLSDNNSALRWHPGSTESPGVYRAPE